MKKILWISRHNMTSEQLSDLERIYGKGISILCYPETIEDMEQLRPFVEECDVIAFVLPPDKMQELLAVAGGKPVIRSVAERRLVYSVKCGQDEPAREPDVIFMHRCWQQIVKFSFETVNL